jgi:hypothetical protein
MLTITAMWIRLTRKLADWVDGIDLSDRRVGEVFNLPIHDAQLLIAEGWAEPHVAVSVGTFRHQSPLTPDSRDRIEAAVARLRHLREQRDRGDYAAIERRRVEDRILEELRDERAITIKGGRKIS